MPHHSQNTDLIVALDYPRKDQALELVDSLRGLPLIYKIGVELFMAGGSEVIRELVHRKHRVILDLKFHDIPDAVARAARQAALLHVDMFTLHLTGGSAMVRAAVQELENIPALRPKILGISVLTSFDDVRWAEVTKAITHHATDVSDSVSGLVSHASGWGVDGIICSALELADLREQYPGLYTVIPGVRPEGHFQNDQARWITPREAHELGANAVIVGRPVIEADNPRQTVESILKDLSVTELSA